VPASPDQVWAAIATGPGIDSWFMGRSEVRPGVAGTVRTVLGEYAPELEITGWDPPRRLAYRSGRAPDGRFIAYEFLVEGRAGGSAVLRTVTSGFIPGDDWAEEFEAMQLGGELYFRTLVEYLAHFAGRFAVPVTAFGPPGTQWARDRELLCRALGWAAVKAPTLVAAGGKSPAWMTNGTRALADALPDSTYRTLPGQNHMVKAQAIAPVLTSFFSTRA